MTKMPLVYQEIKQQLLAELGSKFPAGTRLPPGPQLAKMLGTGQRNTQRALAELTQEGYLISRPRRGTVVAADIDRRLKGKASTDLAGKRVKILVSGAARLSPFIRAIYTAAAKPLRRAGADVQVQSIAIDHRALCLDDLPGGPADGHIIVNPFSIKPITTDNPRNVVMVLTASSVPHAMKLQSNVVTVNDEQGAYLAGDALRQSGCKTACYIGMRDIVDPGSYDATSSLRLRGFEQGWDETIASDHQLTASSYSEASGARAVRDYIKLNPRPQGVFAASDELAVGFMLAATGHGLQLNEHYRLIGFDGQFLSPPYTSGCLIDSVAVPKREMGRVAARLLARRLRKPDTPIRRVVLGCKLLRGKRRAVDINTPTRAARS